MEDNKTTNRKVIGTVLGWLCDYGVKVGERTFRNGYYFFDFGEDSVCHFKVTGAKRWLFGMWCIEDEESGMYRVSMFGEHSDYIDKFKPTATRISYEFTFDPNDEDCMPFEVVRFADNLRLVSAHPSLMKYTHYGHPDQSVFSFLLEEFWYYRVKRNLDGFFEKHTAYWCLKLAALAYRIRFARRGNGFKATVQREDYWYPKYTLKVVYGNMDDAEAERVYTKIHGGTTEIGKPWLIPERVSDISRVEDYMSEDDTRSFYYKSEDEGKEDGDGDL